MGVACGFLLPQYIAYNDFALELTSSQEPGVFERYQAFMRLSKTTTGKMSCMIGYLEAKGFRNCGILRYWTLSNLPLFLLATPMISVMVASGIWGLQHQSVETHLSKGNKSEKHSIQNVADFPILRNLAVSQLLLTLPTFTTAHLQIISRLSSAYPVWMWFESQSLVGGKSSLGKITIRISIMYGLMQGRDFASFLTPA